MAYALEKGHESGTTQALGIGSRAFRPNSLILLLVKRLLAVAATVHGCYPAAQAPSPCSVPR